MKTCTKCKKNKPLDQFYNSKKGKNGLTSYCKTCTDEYNKAYLAKNKEKRRAFEVAYELENKEKRAAQKALVEQSEKTKSYRKQWKSENKDKTRFYCRTYQASKLQRTPKWLTAKQLDEIYSYDTLAEEFQWLSEERLEVDHIIPLNGKLVSGLHVPWNLQVLPKSANSRKSNKVLVK
jgi:hypothetical protein